jgi:spermidine synthase
MQPRPNGRLRWLIVAIGAATIVAQVLVARESLAVFEGNEFSLGVTLAAWLFWTALGSSVAGRAVARGRTEAGRLLRRALVAFGLSLPLTLGLIRFLRPLLGVTPGEALGPDALPWGFLALAPLCVSSGALFPCLAAELDAGHDAAGVTTGRVYLLEALGAAAGGIAGAFFLSGIQAASVALTLLLAALIAAPLVPTQEPNARARSSIYRAVALACVGVGGLLALTVGRVGERLERKSVETLWRGYEILATRQSPYGPLTLATREGQIVVFQNGLALSSTVDEQAAEESVHLPLLEHRAPRRALLIGGGSPLTLGHALRHPSVARLDYVEPDPVLIGLFRGYYPGWRTLARDPRLRIHETDARRFVRDTGDLYDVIMVCLPPPRTLQLNRFYTEEFFREAKDRLAEGGVLALQAPGAENYLSDDLRALLACLRNSLERVFARVIAMPGETVGFFASEDSASLTLEPSVIIERLRARGVRTAYVREYYLPFRLAPDRVADLERETRPQVGTPVNRDFLPAAYYLDFIRWGAKFGPSYGGFLTAVARIPYVGLGGFCLAVGLAGVGLVGFWKRGPRGRRIALAWAVASMGLTLMGLQIFLLLGFQATYGFLYQQIALLIGAFMIGMALGSRIGLQAKRGEGLLLVLQLLLSLWPPALYLVFHFMAGRESAGLAYVAFPLLSAVSGGLGGCHFAVASRLYFPVAAWRASRGFLYSLDLLGAALAAILVSGLLLPVYGFARTAWVLTIINVIALALLMLGRRRAGAKAE